MCKFFLIYFTFQGGDMQFLLDKDKLEEHLHAAIGWLTGPGCCHENTPVGELGKAMNYREWRGAIRGEYNAAEKNWSCCCPYWHTGQAVKALVMAADALGKKELISDAEFSAGFLLANQREDGLFPAREVRGDEINTSASLETLDGLFMLADVTGNMRYREAALAALDWVARNAWMPEKRLFKDIYNSEREEFVFGIVSSQNRPLLDDAVFLTGYRLTGNPLYRKIALDTAEHLIELEDPPGNWMSFIPCNKALGRIHPRHAFWWGLPMLEVYKETGDERFRELFYRSVEWYEKALRRDGGLFRATYSDFKTDSFGHATSGSACAARCFMAAGCDSGDEKWFRLAERALQFCCSMQLTRTADPNLSGVVLEKVLPPDGTDRLPYHVRDLGTIFFIQAASCYLKLYKTSQEVEK